jgi:hypothetical protein
MPPGWLSACACGPAGLASAQGRCTRGLARPARLVGRSHGACSLRGYGGPLALPLPAMRCCTESTARERMRRGTHFRGREFGDLTGDGDLWGGRTQRRRSVPVEEPPNARWHKPHHTVGVAWDLLTEEERRRFELLSSMVENKGVSVQRSPGKTGEGGGASVGVDG